MAVQNSERLFVLHAAREELETRGLLHASGGMSEMEGAHSPKVAVTQTVLFMTGGIEGKRKERARRDPYPIVKGAEPLAEKSGAQPVRKEGTDTVLNVMQ